MKKIWRLGIVFTTVLSGVSHAAVYNFYFNNTEQGPNSEATPSIVFESKNPESPSRSKTESTRTSGGTSTSNANTKAPSFTPQIPTNKPLLSPAAKPVPSPAAEDALVGQTPTATDAGLAPLPVPELIPEPELQTEESSEDLIPEAQVENEPETTSTGV